MFVSCSDQALQRRVEELDREKEKLERRSSIRISSPEVSRVKKERDELMIAVERMEQELSRVNWTIIEKYECVCVCL